MNKIENSEIKSEKLENENEINETKKEEQDEENKKSQPILKNGPQGVSESMALVAILGLFFVFLIIANYVYIIEHTAKNDDISKAGVDRSLKLMSDKGLVIDSNKMNETVLKNLQNNGIIGKNNYEMRHVFGGIIRRVKIRKIKKIV